MSGPATIEILTTKRKAQWLHDYGAFQLPSS